MKKLITAESVTMGHPDKLCDYIADSILDEALKVDPNARVACEVMASKGEITVAGEFTMNGTLPYDDIVNNALAEVGYNPMDFSQHFNIHKQSLDIKNGVDTSLEKRNGQTEKESLGAGDQGVVFGYACKETPELMPMPIMLAHRLARKLHLARLSGGTQTPLRPDGKTQVTVEYNEQGPTKVDTVIVSTQHTEDIADADLQSLIVDEVIRPTLGSEPLEDALILINPSGRFVEGGPSADTGLTGRKLMVDSYGGGHHGGGAFSGKDPTKVDRSGAYMARHIAKTIVAADIAEKCEVQIAYAIGKANPVGFYIDTYGTGKMDDEELTEISKSIFDMRPAAIIDRFGLKQPIYKQTAVYGHFGNPALSWEIISDAEVKKIQEATIHTEIKIHSP